MTLCPNRLVMSNDCNCMTVVFCYHSPRDWSTFKVTLQNMCLQEFLSFTNLLRAAPPTNSCHLMISTKTNTQPFPCPASTFPPSHRALQSTQTMSSILWGRAPYVLLVQAEHEYWLGSCFSIFSKPFHSGPIGTRTLRLKFLVDNCWAEE